MKKPKEKKKKMFFTLRTLTMYMPITFFVAILALHNNDPFHLFHIYFPVPYFSFSIKRFSSAYMLMFSCTWATVSILSIVSKPIMWKPFDGISFFPFFHAFFFYFDLFRFVSKPNDYFIQSIAL